MWEIIKNIGINYNTSLEKQAFRLSQITRSKNGDLVYEGDFVNDKRNGNGKLFYENRSYFVGGFKDGKRHGDGKEYDKNGKLIRYVTYINGEYMRSIVDASYDE